jgi:hypothetical protein
VHDLRKPGETGARICRNRAENDHSSRTEGWDGGAGGVPRERDDVCWGLVRKVGDLMTARHFVCRNVCAFNTSVQLNATQTQAARA